jgi:hypothetical protein
MAVADTAKGSHEAHILRFINENDIGIGSQHILNLLDSFRIEGPNGSHDVLVTAVLVLLRALARYPVYEKVRLRTRCKFAIWCSLSIVSFVDHSFIKP